jgi:acyl-CoA thioesterase-1
MDATRKNVLIIGDSLSIGYTPPVAALLADIALVQHAPWDTQDGGAEETAYLDQCLDNWLHSPSGVPISVDLIWFNSGMHNLGAPGSLPTPGQGGDYGVYAGQLASATARLVEYAARTKTKLLYGLTTPWLCTAATDAVISGVLNANATAIMAANNITVVDQHTPIVEKCGAAPTEKCFGLTGCFCPHCPPGYAWLAQTVIAPAIRKALLA